MDLKDLEFSRDKKPEVLITVDAGYVKLRWTVNLGVREDRIFEDLRTLLTTLEGVEFVKLKRYSASLEIADHVVTEEGIITVLSEVLGKYFEVLGTTKGRTK